MGRELFSILKLLLGSLPASVRHRLELCAALHHHFQGQSHQQIIKSVCSYLTWKAMNGSHLRSENRIRKKSRKEESHMRENVI